MTPYGSTRRGETLAVGLQATGSRRLQARERWAEGLASPASQSRTVPSSSALASVRPSGLKATAPTKLRLSVSVWRARPEAGVPEPHGIVPARRGQALTVGAEGDAKDTVLVALERWTEGLAASASQSRTVLSALAEARRSPSGLKATLRTSPVPPGRWAERVAVSASQSRTVASAARRGQALAVGAEGDAPHVLGGP